MHESISAQASLTEQSWTRREFLSRAVGGVGLACLAHRAHSAPAANRLKVGFLGISHSHCKEKLRLIRESTDWELVGLCEDDAAARAVAPANARWLTADELFAAAEVIMVESGVKDHERDARRALQAGKHVHVEKPPADSMKGLEDLLKIAGQQRLLFQVGYMWRHNPGINAVLEAARQGWLGDIYLVRATMNTLAGAEQRRDWARFRGGAMFEQGCHLIDPVVRLLGRPNKVSPFLKQSGAATDGLADNCVAILEFPRALAIVTSAPLQPNAGPQRFFEVLGTNGTARVQPLEPPGLTVDLLRAAGPYRAGRNEVPLAGYARYIDEFSALAQAVRKKEQLTFTAEQELAVHETLLRACEML